MSEAPRETPSTTVADLPADAVLLDVREDDEWQAGHAPGALHVPMGEVPQHLDELPGGTLHVVCRAGGRSLRVAQWLQAQGRDVVNVEGGMGAWAEAGRPMVSETAQEPFVR